MLNCLGNQAILGINYGVLPAEQSLSSLNYVDPVTFLFALGTYLEIHEVPGITQGLLYKKFALSFWSSPWPHKAYHYIKFHSFSAGSKGDSGTLRALVAASHQEETDVH